MSSAKAHLSVSKAAEELGISETLVRNHIRSGQLTAYRYSARKIVIYKADLEAYKQTRRIAAPKTREAS